jgi:hypothetical protein
MGDRSTGLAVSSNVDYPEEGMGRQIERVPPGFIHPTDDDGCPIAGAHLEILYQLDIQQRTAYQIYENVSDGTPVSPVFDSADELISWLITQGVSREAAEAFIAQGHAPSFVVKTSGEVVSGVEALATKQRLDRARRRRYLRVLWKHSFASEPVELLSELDEARFELRKIEIFRDGQKGYASSTESERGTGLSLEPIPSLADIASDPQFLPEEISREEFELAWENRRGEPRDR